MQAQAFVHDNSLTLQTIKTACTLAQRLVLAFLSATTVTVHVQNRKASKVNSIIRNHFFLCYNRILRRRKLFQSNNHNLINSTSSRLVQALATLSNSLFCQETSLKTYYKVTSVSLRLSKIKSYQVVSTSKKKFL